MESRLALGAFLLVAAYFGYVLLWIAVTQARFFAWHRRNGSHILPLGGLGWASFYLRTVASILRLSWWWAVTPSGRPLPKSVRAGEPGPDAVVLCIHGFHMDESCFWGLRKRLARQGRTSFAVDLGLPYRKPEVYARALHRDLATVAAAFPAARIDVVAHSMGGLVLRHVLGEAPALAARIDRIVTLGTPHHGTALLGWFRHGQIYRMMSRESEYLKRLPPLADSAPGARVTTLASAHDLLVYPVECAHLEHARRITIEAIGHLGLLTDAGVHARVAELLGAPSAPGAGEAGHGGPEQEHAQ